MATVEENRGTNPGKMRRNNNRREAAPGSIAMEFVEGVVDLGAEEILVSGVASVERISKGQVRIAYFVRRKGELTIAVHLIWDRQEWLDMWRTWEAARDSIAMECSENGFCANDNRRREAH